MAEVRREFRATAYEGLGQDYDFVLNDNLGMLALALLRHAAEHKLSDLNVKHIVGITQIFKLGQLTESHRFYHEKDLFRIHLGVCYRQ